jgi:hypothetical protein
LVVVVVVRGAIQVPTAMAAAAAVEYYPAVY